MARTVPTNTASIWKYVWQGGPLEIHVHADAVWIETPTTAAASTPSPMARRRRGMTPIRRPTRRLGQLMVLATAGLRLAEIHRVTSKRLIAAVSTVLAMAGLAACRDRDSMSAASATATTAPASRMRDEALARASVWKRPAIDPGAADFRINTPGPGAFDPDSDVDCTF